MGGDINAIVTKACLILRCFKSKDHSLLFRAFTTYVRPLLEYNSPIWPPSLKISLNRFSVDLPNV